MKGIVKLSKVSHWLSVPVIVAIMLAVIILAVIIAASSGTNTLQSGPYVSSGKPDGFIKWENRSLADSGLEPYYIDALDAWQQQGIVNGSKTITIDAAVPLATSNAAALYTGSYGGEEHVLYWESSSLEWVEYEVEVEQGGLYELHADYLPVQGSSYTRPVEWDVTIDGARQFREASTITLYRTWKDKETIVVNDDGDQVRPVAHDISQWQENVFLEAGANYDKPLKWYFSAGKHVIRLQGYEPVALKSLLLKPPAGYHAYEQSFDAAKLVPLHQGSIVLQAEQMSWKNDPSIVMMWDRDWRTVPRSAGRITYNTMGGVRWDWPNQEAAWEFEVAESGYYSIGMRALQDRFSQKASFRTIKVDGEVPYEELLTYRFPYSTSWKGVVLQDDNAEPYYFYLEKGKHTLSLALTHAAISPIVRGIENLSGLLRDIEQEVRALTGRQIDRNRTWKLDRDLPDVQGKLEAAQRNLYALADEMADINGTRDSISEGFRASAVDIEQLLQQADDIPYYVDEISGVTEKINNFVVNLHKQPLQLDELYIVPYGQSFPDMEASFAEKAWGQLHQFAYSFDTRQSLDDMNDTELNVWVLRGRDYVTQLQDLVNEQFTPATGIKVKVNLLPTTQLLVLSNAAGLQPDVALGLGQDLPVDYAIRGSVYNLAKFDNFNEIYERYSPGSWQALYYDGGYYAVPETQSFQVLYYRKDIMRNLGLDLPQTWDEVYDLLPALQQQEMNFYMDPNEFLPFIYQNDVQFYEADGLKTALDTPAGMGAFKQWTDLYNMYALEKQVPSFYQHFRNGTMPLGISDYNMYVQLSAAAPELAGRWGIALIPGTKQEDGSIARWAGGQQTTGVIFEQSQKKDEAWTFLQWWVSSEAQLRYGSDLEAINGVSFRWNTANLDAFVQLPWKQEDANIILQQWAWYREKENPPGGYFLGRELNNAWIAAVLEGDNYRSALETTVLDINRELLRKQQEFGFVDEQGKVQKSFSFPLINEPWEGVNPYVK